MEDQETVVPEEEVVASEPVAEAPKVEHAEEETKVPLHVVQRERRRRQDAEEELRVLREEKMKTPPVEDESRYESATKEDLGKFKEETIRTIEERNWARSNPDKYQKITDELPQFLKTRPNLALAINAATNRYEEAWELMSAFTPKQQAQIKAKSKSDAPGSPSGIPKSAALNETVDVMRMSDSEFNAWRQQKRGGRR